MRPPTEPAFDQRKDGRPRSYAIARASQALAAFISFRRCRGSRFPCAVFCFAFFRHSAAVNMARAPLGTRTLLQCRKRVWSKVITRQTACHAVRMAHIRGMRHDIVILVLVTAIACTVVLALRSRQPFDGALEPMRTVDISLTCTNPPQRGLMPIEYTCEGQ
jgi:hypothetical protein